jgi:hypothetical protein
MNQDNAMMDRLTDDEINMLKETPNWDEGGRVHNWRNYVPDEARAHWPKINLFNRKVIYIMARGRAYGEEWD